MTEDLNHLEELLASDPDIQAALADHEAACQNDDEDNCVACNMRSALRSLMYIKSVFDNSEDSEEPISELDIAGAFANDLASTLQFISVCQQAIQVLADCSNAGLFIISQEELGSEDDNADE